MPNFFVNLKSNLMELRSTSVLTTLLELADKTDGLKSAPAIAQAEVLIMVAEYEALLKNHIKKLTSVRVFLEKELAASDDPTDYFFDTPAGEYVVKSLEIESTSIKSHPNLLSAFPNIKYSSKTICDVSSLTPDEKDDAVAAGLISVSKKLDIVVTKVTGKLGE